MSEVVLKTDPILPESWNAVRLEEYVKISARIGWRGLKKSEYTKKGPLLLAVKDIHVDGLIDYDGVLDHLSDFRYNESVEIKIKQNDILITKDGTIGKIGFVDTVPQKTTINSSILVVRPLNIIFPRYLFYYFKTPFFQKIVRDKIKGTAVPHLFQHDIKKFQINIAPLNEQKRIVSKIESIFSQIDAGREKLEDVRKLLRQARQSVLKQAFDGKLVSQDPNDEPAEVLLKKINSDFKKELKFEKGDLPSGWIQVQLSKIAYINPPKPEKDLENELEVSFVPMRAVEELTGKINLQHTKKYTQVRKGYTCFTNDDILFAKITPCMENGKIAIARNLINGIGFGSTEFHVIRFKDKAISRKLYFWYLIQDAFRDKAQGKMKGTAGQLRISSKYIEKSLIPLLPLNEQKRIVSKIESIFDKIDAIYDIIYVITHIMIMMILILIIPYNTS